MHQTSYSLMPMAVIAGEESGFTTNGTRAIDPRMDFYIDEDRRQLLIEFLGKILARMDRSIADMKLNRVEDVKMPSAHGELLEMKKPNEADVVKEEKKPEMEPESMGKKPEEAEATNVEEEPEKEEAEAANVEEEVTKINAQEVSDEMTKATMEEIDADFDVEMQPNRHAVIGATDSPRDLVLSEHQDNEEVVFAMCPADPLVLFWGNNKSMVFDPGRILGMSDVSGALLPHPRLLMLLGGIERHFDGAEQCEYGQSEFTDNFTQKMVVTPTKRNQSTDKHLLKFFIYGKTGWIGGLLRKLCEEQGISYENGKELDPHRTASYIVLLPNVYATIKTMEGVYEENSPRAVAKVLFCANRDGFEQKKDVYELNVMIKTYGKAEMYDKALDITYDKSVEFSYEELEAMVQRTEFAQLQTVNLSEKDLVKYHLRQLMGGRSCVKDELLCRFIFPERPGALMKFLDALNLHCNISLFPYCGQSRPGANALVGIQVAQIEMDKFQPRAFGVRGISNRLLFANSVQTSDGRKDVHIRKKKDYEDVSQQFITEELAEVEQMRNTPNFFNKLVDSIVYKFTHEGISLGGDINVCIVGDPSGAKSQFFKSTSGLIPRSVYTSRNSSCAAGLTATVTKEPETCKFFIEAGAQMLIDKGICYIDEFYDLQAAMNEYRLFCGAGIMNHDFLCQYMDVLICLIASIWQHYIEYVWKELLKKDEVKVVGVHALNRALEGSILGDKDRFNAGQLLWTRAWLDWAKK